MSHGNDMAGNEKTCSINECEAVVGNLLRSSTRANFLLESLSAQLLISCQDCSRTSRDVNQNTRAILRASVPLEITVCCNRLRESEIEEVLVHELVHAYDYSKNRCDFSSCEGLAYSEVRAAREAECFRGFFPFEFMRQSCVRDCAIRSTSNLFPKHQAAICVDAVISKGMKDLQPLSKFSQTDELQ